MATYEYKCSECGHLEQHERGINDPDPGYECATCKIDLKRVYSIGNPVFKGSGFYRTDK